MASNHIDQLEFVQTDSTGALTRFVNNAQSLASSDRKALLAAIPNVTSSFAPLAALSHLLEIHSGPWPVLDLQRAYTQVWKLLPEAAKAGRASLSEQHLIEYTLRQCKQTYTSLLDLQLATSEAIAIIDPETGRSITHRQIAAITSNFRLPPRNTSPSKPVVAISLPNGPLIATVILAATSYYTVAPVAHGPGVAKDQFIADVLQSHSDLVLALAADVERLGLKEPWLAEAGIDVYLVELDQRMNLVVRELSGNIVSDTSAPPLHPKQTLNHADDIGILLFTSGTSGSKKLVPLTIHSMVCGVAMVVESWGLDESMRCLNQMALNHVGGLVRNLFAPILSGGSVICCSAFDANGFWDCVEDHRPTWYYASPSMHQCILEAGSERPEAVSQNQIRLIANAAGGLLPTLAIQLRDMFSTKFNDCTVLPSYGMTECMPISTPPLDYRLQKTGTSGISVGPEIAILDGLDRHEKLGVVGRVAVRGAPVFAGYLKNDLVLDSSCFTADGWFDTGDMGYLDSEGYLYITGRSKEVINRGGELISPMEVEEAIVAAAAKPASTIYGRVSKALAFSVTHDVLQEVVGIAVVTPAGSHRACLRGIQEAVKTVLSQVKVPVLLVYMDEGLPTNNNKILRIGLAARLGLPTISDKTPAAGRYFEAVCPPPNTPLSTSISCSELKVSHDCLREMFESAIPASQEVFVRRGPSDFYPEVIIAPSQQDVLIEKHAASAYDPEQLIAQFYSQLHGYNTPFEAQYLDTVFPRKSNGDVDEAMLNSLLDYADSEAAVEDLTPTEASVARAYAHVLATPVRSISSTSHFFELGGDSMGAGKLLNALRKEFPLRLPINVLFANPVVSQLAQIIDERMADQKPIDEKNPMTTEAEFLPGCTKTRSSTNPLLLVFQLLPLVALWPMKRALTWTVFMYVMTASQNWPTNNSIPGRLLDLVISMAVGRIVTRIVGPLVAITFKWLVIGRHKEGLYPMWGSYHTRWWIVEKFTSICGTGVFGLSNMTLIWYYRLLGAKIGKNVKLQKGARLGEWDLINIQDDVIVERATIRPFAAERNTSMYLGRITIGKNASIGLGAIVAAGTTVPAEACIGPNSSSWEVVDADESNRDLASAKVPGAHWALNAFVGVPLSIINAFFTALPWLACLVALVVREPDGAFVDQLQSVLIWFSSPTRVAWHYCALVAHAALAPAFGFACVLVIKAVFDRSCGRITPTAVNERSNMTNFRMQLMQSLMSAATFHKLTELFGTHYDTTSTLARALGAKVGKRVYWPGTGPSIQNFELLDIGDDVVFGSRSHLVTSDGVGSGYVRIGSGAMVADRVVLLPGSQLGEKTVMGSGALAKRGKFYADGTTWVGSKKNEAICLSSDAPRADVTGHPRTDQYYETMKTMGHKYSAGNSTATTLVRTVPDSERSSMHLIEKSPNPAVRALSYLDNLRHGSKTPSSTASRKTSISMPGHRHVISSASSVNGTYPNVSSEVYEMSPMPQSSEPTGSSSPFGRAFYEGKADYHVWSQFTIFCYSTIVAVINATWWNAGSIAAVQVVGHLFRESNWLTMPHGFLHLDNPWRPANLFIFFWVLIVAVMTFQSIVVIAFIIAAKWVIIGRRAPGNYDWDKSSYCQRWQLFLKLETFRRRCYGNNGILGLLTGTHYMTMYFRALGAEIGSDCALFASGNPSLMFTEPDLLTLGDRVTVDDASLVGHINTRGKFDLNKLSVGSRSVLRTGSRLLSGASMEADSCLLEHTLIMAGDSVDEGSTMQGWPAEEFKGKRMPTLEISRRWTVATEV